MFWKPIYTNILCTNFNVFYNHLCFYVGVTVVQQLPDNDEGRSERLGVITNRT